MNRSLGFLLVVLCAASASAAQAQVLWPALIDPSTFVPDYAGDKVIDRGSLQVRGAASQTRWEDFVVARRPDGGYSIISLITPASVAYTAQGRWDFDHAWIATRAVGLGTDKESGIMRGVLIERAGDVITMRRETLTKDGASKTDTWTVPCGRDCFMDMAPSALPMTVMARHVPPTSAGPQAFRWVGISMIQDSVLTEGKARLDPPRLQAATGNDGTPLGIRHWHFVEDLKDDVSGRTGQMHGHFWTDERGFVRKFGMGVTPAPTTIGIRTGDEAFADAMKAD
ncbi:MAG: hypothetical protein SFV21_06190 [Rhodospirillaceae bacterium]|nr:hypothetical protein [Rhodospirillaceae bacterium]